eukprot:9584169-Lingulodinium_polyedra.AAC.1
MALRASRARGRKRAHSEKVRVVSVRASWMTAAQKRAVRTRATLLGAAAMAKKGMSEEVARKQTAMKSCWVSRAAREQTARRPRAAEASMEAGGG